MKKIIFEDTTVRKKPYITINETEYEVEDGTYEGGTDLNADTFNTMQQNIENVFNGDDFMKNIVVENITCKNILNISSFKTQIVSGITITQNYDGSITLNGTSTDVVSVTLNNEKMILEGNYAFGITTSINDVDIGAYIYNSDGSYKRNINLNNPTANLSNGEYIQTFYIYILAGITINNERIYPQLEKGTTPTSFVKPKTFGIEKTDWIDVDLLHDWKWVGGNYNKPQCKREDNIVYIRGSIVKDRTISSNDDRIIFSLPSIMIPTSNSFGIQNGQDYNISLTGDIYFGNITNYKAGDWISLDGLYFFVK